ncbi:MAG: M1 family aminopeptidase [Bryobacteraceae bacterium]|nr:M1 family aminopeptidase [Bryobacteraceae bacterium]
MFRHFFAFEIRFWLTGWMVWIFTIVIGAMILGATSSDQVTVGEAIGNTHRNAPYVIQNFYGIVSVLTLLMTTAFMNSAATRDFQHNTHQMLFSLPIRKSGYLLGRFLGGSFAALVPALGVSLGVLLAAYMPWVDEVRFGPVSWGAHMAGFFTFAVPNTLFIGAILFSVALYFRSTTVSFLAGLLLLVAFGVTDALTSDLKNEALAAMVDPFGGRAFSLATKYWTVAERNTQWLPLQGLFLWNRVLYLALGALIFGLAAARISLGEARARRRGSRTVEAAEDVPVKGTLPTARPSWSGSATLAQFLGTARLEFRALVKTPTFIVVVAAAMLNCVLSLVFNASEFAGNTTFPITYTVTNIIRGTLYMFVIALLTYFAGQLVWKERDERVSEIYDSLPVRDWVLYLAKLLVLLAANFLILTAAVVSGVIVQASKGYTRFQFDVYFQELLLRDYSLFIYLSILAFLFHIILPNKYLGYFGFVAFLIFDAFAWGALNVGTRLLNFGSRPSIPYSDFYGFAPAWEGWRWFTLYWSAFALLLAIGSILFWSRGKENSWRNRLRVASGRLGPVLKPAALTTAAVFLATGAWIFYNTKVLNEVIGPKDAERRRADYEKAYKRYEKMAKPRIVAASYNIDLHPATREADMRGKLTLVNKSAQPISEIHFSLNNGFEHDIRIPGARLQQDDKVLNYRIYKLDPALQPGETRIMEFTTRAVKKGFTNGVERVELTQNGTFFNNTVAPLIGYRDGGELSDRNERRKYGLPEKDLMPKLERDCTANCANTYLDDTSDWTKVETVISTVPDQIAIAPGSLLKEWTENGRRFYHYRLDRASMNFYSFLSASYKVAREDWNGIRLEVYHHPEHHWNVPRMMESMKKSLGYFTQNFGPYHHKQARIIEFPRVARFAQAFPGTMPYSESIGFVADLRDPERIDHVFYVVAHEMGHQWWAHQVIGANMQGATLLSETLAQYSALMVMEREYGRDLMRKFLEYEMDRYLRSRGRERLKERPLLTVESSQGYTHYNKGSVVLYHLKEMICEEAVNRALRSIVSKWAYQGPPYPTSYVLLDALRAETPPEYHPLLNDLFEDITLFSNRTLEAVAKERPDGKYDITVKAEVKKFKADSEGAEKEVPIDDVIEFGAFAAPAKGRKYGKTLHRERVRAGSAQVTRTFTVSELPEKAGVDPFHLLIDRTPDDNTKPVTLQN